MKISYFNEKQLTKNKQIGKKLMIKSDVYLLINKHKFVQKVAKVGITQLFNQAYSLNYKLS